MSNHLATVEFHGHPLVTTLIERRPYVAMRPICQHIGLDWEAQRQRIERHPVLSTCAVVIQAQLSGDKQRRQMTLLPIEHLHGWLFGVDTNRVKPELRETLITYQRECYTVLDAYWRNTPYMEQPSVRPGQAEGLHRESELASLREENTALKDELLNSMRAQLALTGRANPLRRRADLTAEEKARIESLHAQGVGPVDIGRVLNRRGTSIMTYLRRRGLRGTHPEASWAKRKTN